MTTLTIYKANDGSEHRTAEAARHCDLLFEKVKAIMSPLGVQHDGSNKGWIQHNPTLVVVCRDAILQLCEEEGYSKDFHAFKNRGPKVHPMSIIGRILGDYGGPIDTAWRRFGNIDPQGREHQQCYYAYTNGPEPEHICIEDRR